MDSGSTLFLAAFGVACIYIGYRLFCGLPVMNGRRPASWSAVVLMNIVPGALLASLGMAILTAEARHCLSYRPAIRQTVPAAEGTSWHRRMPKAFDHAG